MADVLGQIAEADLVKMDIEGGEWGILADPRIARQRALVLEYHPRGLPARRRGGVRDRAAHGPRVR